MPVLDIDLGFPDTEEACPKTAEAFLECEQAFYRGTPIPLFATMLHPTDKVRRDRFKALWSAIDTHHENSHLRETLAGILVESYIEPEQPWVSGMTAGKVLITIRQIHEHHQDYEASVGKAVHLLNSTRSSSRASIMRMWAEYKSVSHLWAALWLSAHRAPSVSDVEIITVKDFAEKLSNLLTGDRLPIMWLLAAADDMRRFGEEHQTRRGISVLTWSAFQLPP